jgi:hypothetical protein
MSFYDAPRRRLWIIHGCGCFAIAIAIFAFSFSPDVNVQWRNISDALTGLFVLMGLLCLCFWLAWRTRPDEIVTVNPELARYYHRILWFIAIGFPALTAYLAHDLNQLESGAVESIRINRLLAPIYIHLGYWPTVIFLPFLGAFAYITTTYRLCKLAGKGSAENT